MNTKQSEPTQSRETHARLLNQTGDPPFFRCHECGCKALDVIRRFVQVRHIESWLACDCGAIEEAAIRRERVETLCEQSGPLDESHHYDLDTPEVLDELGRETESHEVFCPKCVEGADEMCWQQGPHEVQVEDEEFFVRCHGCDRDIEFGWSHPDRGGRIWPVECADFNPWLSWPEHRYVESWHKKGWLRPIEAAAVAEKIGRPLEEIENLFRTGVLAKHPTSKELATDSFGLEQFLWPYGRPKS